MILLFFYIKDANAYFFLIYVNGEGHQNIHLINFEHEVMYYYFN